MSHFIVMCSECGNVIRQCRCMSADKKLTHEICDKCSPKNLINAKESTEKERQYGACVYFNINLWPFMRAGHL